MSDTLTIDLRAGALTINIGSSIESGVYAGVAVLRVTSLNDAVLNSMTCRAAFQTLTSDSYDVDVITLRKIPNVHTSEDSQSVIYVYYFELHVHKKVSQNATLWFNLSPNWAPYTFTAMKVSTLMNTSLVSYNSSSTQCQFFEVDPASKARQIYDSV